MLRFLPSREKPTLDSHFLKGVCLTLSIEVRALEKPNKLFTSIGKSGCCWLYWSTFLIPWWTMENSDSKARMRVKSMMCSWWKANSRHLTTSPFGEKCSWMMSTKSHWTWSGNVFTSMLIFVDKNKGWQGWGFYDFNSCYYSWARRQNFFCLQLHAYEAKGSIQWEMTH